jgi:hypothetical protein
MPEKSMWGRRGFCLASSGVPSPYFALPLSESKHQIISINWKTMNKQEFDFSQLIGHLITNFNHQILDISSI